MCGPPSPTARRGGNTGRLPRARAGPRIAPPVAPGTLIRYETGACALNTGVTSGEARALGCRLDALAVGSLSVWEFENACRDEWHALGRPADLAAMELIESRMWERRRAG